MEQGKYDKAKINRDRASFLSDIYREALAKRGSIEYENLPTKKQAYKELMSISLPPEFTQVYGHLFEEFILGLINENQDDFKQL